MNPEIYSYKFINEDIELIVDIKDKNLGLFTLSIFLTQNYPFEIPYVKLEFMVNFLIFFLKKFFYFEEQRHLH